jgi:hypothetical protein
MKRSAVAWSVSLALAVSSFLAFGAVSTQAQALTFPVPSTTGILGKKDTRALTEIKAHLMAVSAAGWQGFEATGTLTYPDGYPHPASLYLMGAKRTRLDIEMASGTRSLRLVGFAGRFQDEKGNQGSLTAATSSAGIVAFPRIWAEGATSLRISLYDRNSYTAAGQSLDRITLEYPIEGTSGDQLGSKTAATDLYFDPNNHLLCYSVDALTYNNVSAQTHVRITSYADYQQFNGIKAPATIKQYLNGQLQWTLQLSQVTVNPAEPATTFSF